MLADGGLFTGVRPAGRIWEILDMEQEGAFNVVGLVGVLADEGEVVLGCCECDAIAFWWLVALML